MRRALFLIMGLGFLLMGMGILADIDFKIKENIGGAYYVEYKETDDRIIEGCTFETESECEENDN